MVINLQAFERNVFSQSGEDGVLEKLFEIVGTTNRFVAEFGAGDGVYLSNARSLILQGWSACLIEGDPAKVDRAVRTYIDVFPRVRIAGAYILPSNIEERLLACDTPAAPDLMAIDLDGNDYYVWEAITKIRPRVLMMEYNASFPPPAKRVVKYHPDNFWDLSDYFGASLQSLVDLNKQKGYELIYCMRSGINAIFVDAPLLDRFDLGSNDVRLIYQPPRYGVGGGRGPGGHGHPARDHVPLTLPDGTTIAKEWVELP